MRRRHHCRAAEYWKGNLDHFPESLHWPERNTCSTHADGMGWDKLSGTGVATALRDHTRFQNVCFFIKFINGLWPPPRPVFIKVRTTFFKTIKYHPIKNIFNFLQGLVGFGNLRFAEIKSCPSASPTYELRKVEISCQKWLFMHILCCKYAHQNIPKVVRTFL